MLEKMDVCANEMAKIIVCLFVWCVYVCICVELS